MKRKTIWVVTHDGRYDAPPHLDIIGVYDVVGVYADQQEAHRAMVRTAKRFFRVAGYKAEDHTLYASSDSADIMDNFTHRSVHHYEVVTRKMKV